MLRSLLLLFVAAMCCARVQAQSLIVGIPSADVAEKHHVEITHETQWNFWNKPGSWNSFNFLCYGLGNNTEVAVTFNNLSNTGSESLAAGAGIKKVFPLNEHDGWEQKLTAGTNVLYSLSRRDVGVWSYGHYSVRLPGLRTRLTSGLSYGQSQTYGFRTVRLENNQVEMRPINTTSFIAAIEQPIYKNISFVADWYSGNHALAAFIPAVQVDVGHHVFIAGYKIPNGQASGKNALILEVMLNLSQLRGGH